MFVERTHAELLRLYDLPPQGSIRPFLCSAAEAESLLGHAPDRDEVLLVSDGDDPAMSLYLAPELVERVSAGDVWSDPARLADASIVLEGVSHFTYVAWRAARGEPVTELELEVQAEVDKYALALLHHAALVGRGVGLLRASQALRLRLFERVSFVDEGHTPRGARYRRANEAAARTTSALEARWLGRGDLVGAVHALRGFYRRRREQKLAAL